MRMIVAFEKGAGVRFIGHLDLMRTMQRALRRSRLPLRFSNGFNPHIKMSFAIPLSVGVIGQNELMDVPLSEDVAEESFLTALNAVLPSPIHANRCFRVEDNYPSLMSLVAGADYRIAFPKDETGTLLVEKFDAFVSQESCMAMRKTKSGENMCDIFQFVLNASLAEEENGYAVSLHTLSNAGGMLKPSLWMESLCAYAGIDAPDYLAYRVHILGKNARGELVPLEELA